MNRNCFWGYATNRIFGLRWDKKKCVRACVRSTVLDSHRIRPLQWHYTRRTIILVLLFVPSVKKKCPLKKSIKIKTRFRLSRADYRSEYSAFPWQSQYHTIQTTNRRQRDSVKKTNDCTYVYFQLSHRCDTTGPPPPRRVSVTVNFVSVILPCLPFRP